ncbi:MAG: glycosyltransferase family A protein [Actinomycetota bacterium]
MTEPTSQPDPRSVSVVVATRDRPELLRRALDAIEAQDVDHDLEVIVVFDRSEPDRSLEFERPGRRLVVTTNARTPGLPGARNSGIDKAGNQWIAFCDDDDEWFPGKLSAQFAAIDRSPGAKAACTGIFIRYEGEDTPRIPDPARLTFEGFLSDRMTEVHPSSWLIQREWLTTEVGLVDEEIPGGYAEDYDLMLRAARLGPIAVAPEPLVRVWWHGASFFFERWKMIDEALDYLLAKYPEFADDAAGWARIEGQRAVAQAAMGQRRRALATIGGIVRRRPLEKRVPVAVAVALGVPPGTVLAAAHRFGRGI